jgi:hypothetical protein
MATISKILICPDCKKSYDVTYLVLDVGLHKLNAGFIDPCPHCKEVE